MELFAVSLPNGLSTSKHALFLDFDGTLTALAMHPDAVVVEADLVRILKDLSGRLGGALAVVSGRQIEVVDRYLQPLRLPSAGEHGLCRRNFSGGLSGHIAFAGDIDTLRGRIALELGSESGIVLEVKSGSIAVHYRARPELETRCSEIVSALALANPSFRVQGGKMVFELLTGQADKASAIRAFLGEAPFKGRKPIFAGDDATDEPGFRLVNELGGITIKVGPGPTLARWHAASPRAMIDWLDAFGREEIDRDEGLAATA